MTSPPADINWLLSALTQASAALIAIVGGLLVSRYVALHAEQQAAQRRVADLQRRESESRDRLKTLNASLDTHVIDDVLFTNAVYETIIQDSFEPTVKAALAAAEEDGGSLNQDLLQKRLQALSSELRSAWDTLTPLVPESEVHPNWADFKRQHDFPVEIAPAWEWFYGILSEAMEQEARNRRQSTGNFLSSTVMDQDLRRSLRPHDFAGIISSQHSADHLKSLRDRINETDSEVRSLSQERRLASETYESTRQPEGFSLALQVLSVIAFLGMVIPVAIMGIGTMAINLWARVAVICSFFAGVALLLRFLFAYASFLREGGRGSLPRTALGLLLP